MNRDREAPDKKVRMNIYTTNKAANAEPRTPAESHAAMTWAQRLKRVFNIDIEVCGRCGGAVRVIVEASNRCIEDQETIDKVN